MWAYFWYDSFASGIKDTSGLPYELGFTAFWVGACCLISGKVNQLTTGHYDPEWTLTPSAPIDRALIVQGLTRVQKLVSTKNSF